MAKEHDADDRDACIEAMTAMGRLYVRGFSEKYDFPVVRRIVAAYLSRATATQVAAA